MTQGGRPNRIRRSNSYRQLECLAQQQRSRNAEPNSIYKLIVTNTLTNYKRHKKTQIAAWVFWGYVQSIY